MRRYSSLVPTLLFIWVSLAIGYCGINRSAQARAACEARGGTVVPAGTGIGYECRAAR